MNDRSLGSRENARHFINQSNIDDHLMKESCGFPPQMRYQPFVQTTITSSSSNQLPTF